MSPCGCCVRVGALGRVADGVDEVRRAVREELQMGADQIKIMASGGVASPTDPVGAWGYSEDEIRAIVAEARGRQTYVLAHAYTPDGHRAGGALRRAHDRARQSDRRCHRAPDRGTRCVSWCRRSSPTRRLQAKASKYGLPEASLAKVADVHDAGLRSLEIMKRAGVQDGLRHGSAGRIAASAER